MWDTITELLLNFAVLILSFYLEFLGGPQLPTYFLVEGNYRRFTQVYLGAVQQDRNCFFVVVVVFPT